jgi:hypothetical protein
MTVFPKLKNQEYGMRGGHANIKCQVRAWERDDSRSHHKRRRRGRTG